MINTKKRVETLLEVIEDNPGIKFRELMRTTGLKNGVLSHHLGKLEKSGSVLVQRTSRQSRYYLPQISENQQKIITALRRDTPRRILQSLMLNKNGLEFNQIVDFASKAPSTVSIYLSELVDEGIVKMFIKERKRKYVVAERETIAVLIEEYQPGLLGRATTGFEDIISSL